MDFILNFLKSLCYKKYIFATIIKKNNPKKVLTQNFFIMKKNIILLISIMLIVIAGIAQKTSSKSNCPPVTNLTAEYTDNCAAKLTWVAPGKATIVPFAPKVIDRKDVKEKPILDARFFKGDPNAQIQTEPITAENFLRGPNSQVIYKPRHEMGTSFYKATLSSFPGSAIGSSANAIQCMEYINNIVYAVNYASGVTSFGTINQSTGAWTTIKANCGIDAVSLCYNPTNGLTYFTQWNGGTFGTIDLATGAISPIASFPMGGTETIFMAIDNDGVAYGIRNQTNTFGKINLATGEFTNITTNLSFKPTQIQNLGVDRETNELYWMAHSVDVTSNTPVYKIDKTNGVLTSVATLSQRVEAFAILTDAPKNCDPVTELTYEVAGNNVTLSWEAAPGSPTGYIITMDGTPLTTVTTTTYTHTNVPDGLHIYGVAATYSGSCIPLSVLAQVIVGNYCFFRIEMEDSYGDGWIGEGVEDFSSIQIKHGNNYLGEYTVPYDAYVAIAYPLLPVGEIEFYWVNQGSEYDDDCAFKIYNSKNELICEKNFGDMYGFYGKFLTYQNDCGFNFIQTYSIFRDGVLLKSAHLGTTYTDIGFDKYEGHVWAVKADCEDGGESDEVEVELGYCINSVNDIAKTDFAIAPNPASNQITIKTAGNFNTVEIVSFLGQIVLTQSNDGNKATIDVSNLFNGIYFVRIISENGISVKKFVKQ